MKFPETIQIPLDVWIEKAMDWVLINFAGFFDALGTAILQFMLIVEKFFLWLPWPVLVIGTGLLGWRLMGKWWSGLIMAGMLFFMGTLGYWELSMRTLSLVTSAVIVSLAIGIPIGILMATSDTFESITKPLLDGMQTMSSFVYLITALRSEERR